MDVLGSGRSQRRHVASLSGTSGVPESQGTAHTPSGLSRVFDAFLGSGRRSQPLQSPVFATQGDDLKPGQLRLESDFRPGERDLHHLRLDTANRSSGSSQFTAAGLAQIQAEVQKARLGARLVIVDLRQESHGLLHGQPVEWMGPHNQANRGKSAGAVFADEGRRLAEVGGQSEAELCARAGVEYLRLPVTDHLVPDEATVKEFLRLAERLEREGAWVHFHCKAGRGRTTTFMALWEMFRARHGAVDAKATAERQRSMGGIDLMRVKPRAEDGGSSEARRDFVLAFGAGIAARSTSAPCATAPNATAPSATVQGVGATA